LLLAADTGNPIVIATGVRKKKLDAGC